MKTELKEYLIDGNTTDLVKKAVDMYLYLKSNELTEKEESDLLTFRTIITAHNRQVISINMIAAK